MGKYFILYNSKSGNGTGLNTAKKLEKLFEHIGIDARNGDSRADSDNYKHQKYEKYTSSKIFYLENINKCINHQITSALPPKASIFSFALAL